VGGKTMRFCLLKFGQLLVPYKKKQKERYSLEYYPRSTPANTKMSLTLTRVVPFSSIDRSPFFLGRPPVGRFAVPPQRIAFAFPKVLLRADLLVHFHQHEHECPPPSAS
jgi:hypothetical protein